MASLRSASLPSVFRSVRLGLGALALSLGLMRAHGQALQPLNVMLYNKQSGHLTSRDLIKTMLERLSAKHGFKLTVEENQDAMTYDNLKKFDVVVWTPNEQGTKGLKAELWPEFQKYIELGGGYIGMHSAVGLGVRDWPWVSCMTMQWYDGHVPPGTPGKMILNKVDSKRAHPAHINRFFEGLREPAIMGDEYYGFKADPRTSNLGITTWGDKALPQWQTPAYGGDSVWVLLRIDENSTAVPFGRKLGEHPLVWARQAGAGKFIASSIGHDDLWSPDNGWGDEFVWHMINWAGDRYEGSTSIPEVQGRAIQPWSVMEISNLGLTVKSPGAHQVTVRSGSGRIVLRAAGAAPAHYAFAALPAGYYTVSIRTSQGGFQQHILKY